MQFIVLLAHRSHDSRIFGLQVAQLGKLLLIVFADLVAEGGRLIQLAVFLPDNGFQGYNLLLQMELTRILREVQVRLLIISAGILSNRAHRLLVVVVAHLEPIFR